MFDPSTRDASAKPNPGLFWGMHHQAGLRLARERQVNVRVVPTSHAIDESLDLAHEIFNRIFRKIHRRPNEKWDLRPVDIYLEADPQRIKLLTPSLND